MHGAVDVEQRCHVHRSPSPSLLVCLAPFILPLSLSSSSFVFCCLCELFTFIFIAGQNHVVYLRLFIILF